jgi:hypothetical protein
VTLVTVSSQMVFELGRSVARACLAAVWSQKGSLKGRRSTSCVHAERFGDRDPSFIRNVQWRQRKIGGNCGLVLAISL